MTAIDAPARSVRARSDYADLSARIRAAGLLERRTGYYVAKFALTVGVFAAAWTAFVLIGPSWWQLVTAAVLGVLSTQIAMLGHDAGHKQVTRTRRSSYLIGILLGNLAVGLSFGWWIDKHNRHHAHPNHEDLDPDVAPAGPLIFLAGQAEGRRGVAAWFTRHQAVVFFPILLLEGLNLHVGSFQALRDGTVSARWREGSLLAVPAPGRRHDPRPAPPEDPRSRRPAGDEELDGGRAVHGLGDVDRGGAAETARRSTRVWPRPAPSLVSTTTSRRTVPSVPGTIASVSASASWTTTPSVP